MNESMVFKKQEVSIGSIYYRTVRVDKDEKILDLESSGSLMLSARAIEGTDRGAEASNSSFFQRHYLRILLSVSLLL